MRVPGISLSLLLAGPALADPDTDASAPTDEHPPVALAPEPVGLAVGHPETKGTVGADDIATALEILAPTLRHCFAGAPTGSLVLGFALKRRGIVTGAHITESSFAAEQGDCLVRGLEGAMLVPGAAGTTTVSVRWGYRAEE